jgi:diaminohydroxyphosphoribosylaminopyrimidine deaminase / 5-amino-6-(5-phosphoribosylamino)uracil reductase
MNVLKDAAYMGLAYSLAEKARGYASPNPYVGALVVKDDVIIGHGYHEGPGKPHAEIVALDRAGRRAKGATLYITLEPCVHWGRTPPCVDVVISVGLKRVVVSALDPNPLVFQKGVRRIREAGLAVSVGILSERNRLLNEFYSAYITRKTPFVTLKAALSLDGKMATRTYDSQWISSAAVREYIHLLRGEYDALLVGINTVLRDDPRMTVRHPNWPNKRIARIVLDPELRLPLGSRLLATLPRGPVLVFTAQTSSLHKRKKLEKSGVEIFPSSGRAGKIDLGKVFAALGRREISSVLVEGGGRIATSLLESKLADKVLLALSPRLIGGSTAVSFFAGDGARVLEDALSLNSISAFRIGEETILEGYL